MLRLTLAQMRRSLPRLVAAGLAILLGSAFLTATLTAGDAITRGGYDAITASYGSADLVVAADEVTLADALEVARDTPGVTAADPLVLGWASFTSGRRSVSQAVLAQPSAPSLASLEVVDGRAPTSSDEVALPPSTAERLGVGVGDTVRATWVVWSDEATAVPTDEAAATSDEGAVATPAAEPAPTQPVATESTADVAVVGLVDDPRGAWSQYGGAGSATVDAVVLWSGRSGLDESGGTVLVEVGEAADVEAVRTAISEDLAGGGEVLTRDEAAIAAVEHFGGGNVIVMLVLGFAAVALLVAGLVIANTFQVIVAQRTRMLALLRCVGARRGQLRASVLLEAGILGLASGTAGVLVGLGLSQAALSVLARTQDGVPLPTTVHPTLTNVVLPVVVGTLVTVGAALVPARAATRVSPVAALRPADDPSVRARPGRVRLAFSLLLTLGGVAALLGGVAMGRAGYAVDAMLPLAVAVLGGATSFVGLLVGAPLWIPAVVSAVGRPVAAISTTARLAAANTVRNPRRTSATSTALVIGVTLVMMMSTGAVSAQASLAREMDERAPVDLVATRIDGAAFTTDVREDVAALDGVAAVVPARSGLVEGASAMVEVLVVGPEQTHVVRDAVAADALASGRSVVPRWWADDATQVEATGGRTARIDVLTRATDGALLTTQAADDLALDEQETALLVLLDPGADAMGVMQDVQDAVGSDAVQVASAAAERQSDERFIDVVLAVVIGLLGVAVLIALIGVANTLSLSVIERRRESATLRAVGLSRRGLRWMLATEGMLIAVVGALIGTVLGLLYGWAGVAAVFGPISDVRLSVPWAHVGAVLVVAVLAGLAASALPARSAARTPPVAALGVD
ncbi:ABC transporter permease [Cellulomonas wangsupingiae]|uniref:ABC transporter permease n=1 Tax=Cellulomonas wangsupingiae TaxID=2968085 RepID=A0ABY5K2C3_9CELL|nr:FtsX-like permease family protein [Cellulomonas wangsupingiae]MCC2335719.1 ABC transporter permease [Cellulomonas wangsupingiae]MCM0640350.1 ABC transporter permease [Cellulomonas wangsupingiae]UUI63954.1 ABC transporter permease [Cellulomonas wangsupingiae]